MSGQVQSQPAAKADAGVDGTSALRPAACCGQAPEPRSGAPQAQGLRAARLAAPNWRGPLSHSDRTLSGRSNTHFYTFLGASRLYLFALLRRRVPGGDSLLYVLGAVGQHRMGSVRSGGPERCHRWSLTGAGPNTPALSDHPVPRGTCRGAAGQPGRRSGDPGLLRPAEGLARPPHRVHRASQAARQGDLGPPCAWRLRQPHGPGLQG